MTGSYRYVVFLDLDKTLTGTNSGYALVRTAYEKGFLRKRDLFGPLMMLLFYKAGLRPADSIISSLGEKLRGVSYIEFEEMAREAVNKYLIGSVFPEARKEISLHQNQNALSVILSSAVEGICIPIARHLSIDQILCTVMDSSDGKLTGSPSGEYCYGSEKSRRLNEFCSENGFNTKEAFYYADSMSDVEALQSVGNPVCINPDRRLLKHAKRKGWRIIYWKVK